MVNHPDAEGRASGCCTGFAETALRFDSPATGLVDVAMCNACATATLAARDDAVRSSP